MQDISVPAEAGFRSAADADRPIAGAAAAARAVKALADGGASHVRLLLADGRPLAAATLGDIERARGDVVVTVARGVGPAVLLPNAWDVVRSTGKAGDGLVSRSLNRPISQRLTRLLLATFPAIRPIHVTLFNALLALAMVPILVFGGGLGLILGGIMFHAASVLDGVDGEMARATWRSSPQGATLDSVIDIATNLLFVAGLTINLALRDGDYIGWLGLYALVVSIVGGALLAWRSRAGGGPVGFDLLKRREHRFRGPIDFIYWAVQTLTGRDCFAFLYMVLIIIGLERTALGIYAAVGTIWLPYVVLTVLLSRSGARPTLSPILEPQPIKDSVA
jgi:1L-myo-inositol 1-phosphate cytidylyltransferase / CDP-L-myo-inositol myo-inositolphosphotransferase